jgi:hypothetical protein
MNSSKFETTKLWRVTMDKIRLLALINGKSISQMVDDIVSNEIMDIDPRDIESKTFNMQKDIEDRLNAYI